MKRGDFVRQKEADKKSEVCPNGVFEDAAEASKIYGRIGSKHSSAE